MMERDQHMIVLASHGMTSISILVSKPYENPSFYEIAHPQDNDEFLLV
jgi:hypothetical protein